MPSLPLTAITNMSNYTSCAPNCGYSWIFSPCGKNLGYTDKAEARWAMSRAEEKYGDKIVRYLGGRLVHWVLTGGKHELTSEKVEHWMVRGFDGAHAFITLHVFKGHARHFSEWRSMEGRRKKPGRRSALSLVKK